MITAAEVIDYLGAALDASEIAHMNVIIPAVIEEVNSLPSIDLNVDGTWKATTKLGAIMLAARLFSRRNSPNGTTTTADGVQTYLPRYDNDIARLLHIDAFREPMVG